MKKTFTAIHIELTSACDMACAFCPNPINERPAQHMHYDLFASIIDDIIASQITDTIILYGVGESLLYPKLIEAINYCTTRGLYAQIYTNGLAITAERYQKMADSGLKLLEISLHDLTEDSFEYRHAKRKVSYDRFYHNILNLIDHHLSQHLPVTLIISLMFCKEHWITGKLWDFPAMKKNTKNAGALIRGFIDQTREIANKNVTKHYLTEKDFYFSLRALDIFDSKLLKITENVLLKITSLNPRFFNTNEKLLGPAGKKIKLVKKTKGKCPLVPTNGPPMILSDGSFVPCSVDELGELTLGKVTLDTPLTSIIKGDKYKTFVKEILDEKLSRPLCQICRGELVYKNQLDRISYALRSFNPYGIYDRLQQRCRIFFRKNVWEKIPVSRRASIKKHLARV